MKRAALLLLFVGASAVAAPEHIVRVDHHDPSAAPARGPLDAPVTVELFFFPEIPTSPSRVAGFKLLKELQARHPTRVRLIWRVLRQGMISTAALEAHAQGKFDEFLERVASERVQLTKDGLFKLVASIGLDADRVAAAIADDRYGQTFTDNDRRAKRLHVAGQPMVLMNSTQVRFPQTAAELDKAYDDAYVRARDLLEQGVPANELSAAFDAQELAKAAPNVTRGTDDDDTHDQWLVSPPIATAGLPSVGDDDATTTITFLCPPANGGVCLRLIERALAIQKDIYPDLKIVWAPWFDVTLDGAWELAMYSDAVLCAEAIGAGAPPKSPGWLWVDAMYREFAQRRGRVEIEQRIDAIAKQLELDPRRLAACRARMAGTSLAFIADARASGIRVSPSVIIGGRIYANLGDPSIVQALIEAERAPGISDTLREHVGVWRP